MARRSSRRVSAVATVAMATTMCWVGLDAGSAHAAMSTVVHYEMNEGSSASTMRDSGPFGIHGTVGGKIVTANRLSGATGYRWLYKPPNAAPVERDRLALVADDDRIDRGTGDYAIEFRYQSTNSFGNVVQKGQNGSPGGYFKFEQPLGKMTCLFKDKNGLQRAVRNPKATNDGAWHTIRCELTDWGIKLFVDGKLVAKKQTSMAEIDNSRPLSIGGKENCNQRNITCDYFTGRIDYVKIDKGGSAPPPPPPPPPNQPPTASFTAACDGLTCSFDGGASSDPDGSIVSRVWTFGDGSGASGVSAQHTFGADGSYQVGLTVVDDDGVAATAQQTVTVGSAPPPPPPPPPPSGDVSFVGSESVSRWSSAPTITLPTLTAGDTVVLFANAASPVQIGEPSGPSWRALGTSSSAKLVSRAWVLTASDGDSGRSISVPLSTGAKSNLTAVVYRGLDGADPVAVAQAAVATGTSAQRTTPTVIAPAGSWAVSFWAHRDSSTTSLAAPGGVVVRDAATMSGGGRPTVLVADSGQALADGPTGGLTATAQAASGNGIGWTIVLRAG